jgi:hypothetical protein
MHVNMLWEIDFEFVHQCSQGEYTAWSMSHQVSHSHFHWNVILVTCTHDAWIFFW